MKIKTKEKIKVKDYIIKDTDELVFTGKQIKEFKEIIKAEAIEKKIKWLQSVLDTKHIAEESRWIIEGRISKLQEINLELSK